MRNAHKAMIIARAKELQRLKNSIDEITPIVYSCFALALSDKKYGWTPEQIRDLFDDTQWLWNKAIEKEISMPEFCLQKTGIDVISRTAADKRGVDESEII